MHAAVQRVMICSALFMQHDRLKLSGQSKLHNFLFVHHKCDRECLKADLAASMQWSCDNANRSRDCKSSKVLHDESNVQLLVPFF